MGSVAQWWKKASELVVDSIMELCWDTKLVNEKTIVKTIKEAISRAKVKIKRFAKSNEIENMGATLAILYLNPQGNVAHVLHAGDCRIYRWRQGELRN